MADFFPPGFWKVTVMATMVVLSVLGVDLLLGSRLMMFLGHSMNKKIHIDQLVVNALSAFQKKSNREFDTEASLVKGLGRLAVSGIIFLCVYLMFSQLLPKVN